MKTLLALAEELERAPAEQGFSLLWKAICLAYKRGWLTEAKLRREAEQRGEVLFHGRTKAERFLNAGAYLSAADVLRPEGWTVDDLAFSHATKLWQFRLIRWDSENNEVAGNVFCRAQTEPMARAAAAIRAWVAMEEG